MARPQRIERDGKTLYRVQIRRPTKGLRIDEYFSTKRAADAFVRRVERDLDDGTPIQETADSRETVADAIAAYLVDPLAFTAKNGRPLKPSYVNDRTKRLRFLARPHKAGQRTVDLGGIHLRRLTWRHIDEALAALKQERGWTSRTRYQFEVALSRLLTYAKGKGWIAVNVVAGQDRLNETVRRERCYTRDEWRRLLAAADARDDMLGMFLQLAWETGCRKSELLRLRWVDITPLDDGSGLGAKLGLRETKNHQNRTVFVSFGAHERLKAHRRRYQTNESPLVFPARGALWDVDKPFRDARVTAGLDTPDERFGEVLTLHHIRHTWATDLGASGATLAELMSAGGWQTPGMATRYMKLREQQAREAALKLMRR